MSTRRNFLAGVASVAAVTGLAGCGVFDDDSDDDPAPDPGEETDDELLNALADPSSQVPPLYFSGYQYQLGELGEEIDPTETIPRAGGAVAGLFDDQLDGVSLADVNRITGSVYNSTASGGSLQFQPLPSGQAVHATGAFGTDSIRSLLEESDPHEPLDTAEGYEAYMAEIQGGDGLEAWAFQDGRLIIVNRTDVTSRTPDYDTKEETATDALEIEFDQIDRDDAPIVSASPGFAQSIQNLGAGPLRAGASYALVPLGSDAGTAAFDDAISGVVGAGVGATFDEDPMVQRSVSYLVPEMASAETVRSAYEAIETPEMPVERWEFATNEATVTAEAALDQPPTNAMVQTGLPVPGYQSLFTRINPEELNRDPTPRVFFEAELDDGQIQITHVGGGSVEDLQVRYVSNGEEQRESWDSPVTEGDTFTSEETVDGGTRSWVTWRPDTVDAAVLVRFETPA